MIPQTFEQNKPFNSLKQQEEKEITECHHMTCIHKFETKQVKTDKISKSRKSRTSERDDHLY